MPEVRLITPITRQNTKKMQVAAYCRVSSNSADQLNSYAAQIRAYKKYIGARDDWELVDIFADEGLTGMKSETRDEFQRMILDEVLSVGDGAFRKKSEAKMREIIQGGATTILVSHSIEQVRSLCSKVLWLHKGEQIAFGAAEPLCDLYQQFLDKKVTIQQVRETVSGQ